MSNTKIANINIKIKDLFFKWIEITRTFHQLTNQQCEVLALLLYHHYILKKEVTNNKILWKMVFDYDTKLKIREELGISDNVLQNTLTVFRKKYIIVDNEISKNFIPDLTLDSKNFKIIFNFNIIDND